MLSTSTSGYLQLQNDIPGKSPLKRGSLEDYPLECELKILELMEEMGGLIPRVTTARF